MTDTSHDTLMPARVRNHVPLHRHIIAGLWAAGLLLQFGCYRNVPVVGMREVPNVPVSITLNDKGRTLFGAKFGNLVDRFDGRLLAADSAKVEIAIGQAVDAKGAFVNWADERAVVPRDAIRSLTARRVSQKRTWSIIGAISGAVLVLFLLISKNGFGADDPVPDPTPI